MVVNHRGGVKMISYSHDIYDFSPGKWTNASAQNI